MRLTLQQLANSLELELRGDPDLVIDGVSSPGSAQTGDLCYLQGKKNLAEIVASRCSAVILPEELAERVSDKALLFSPEPNYSFAQAILALDLDPLQQAAGIHPSAQVAQSAQLAAGVRVGANAVIEENVKIGANSVIGAGCVIEPSASIGSDCHLHSHVILAHSVRLGDRCILQSGVVIGGDGFGLAMHQQQWSRIPQIGSVTIEDDVEIGANTTIDRGALDDTVIERGCKLDNQIMVGHNVRIGAHTAIAACCGIAGSAIIGRHCQIAGACTISGHLRIADHVVITMASLVIKNIKESGVYSSGMPVMENNLWRRTNVRYKALDKLAKTVAELEKRIGK
jgi:UDP-3-O-[3-hydroxymyristoyl] glucosamine N-acyltransferase